MRTWHHKLTFKVFIVIIFTAFSGIILSKLYAAETLFEISVGLLPPIILNLDKNNPKGLFLEIVHDSFKSAKIQFKILDDKTPWKRAVIKSQADNLIYYLYRTSEREKKYIWLQPLFDDQTNVYNLKKYEAINNKDQLQKIKNIGTLAGGAGESILKSLGLEGSIYFCKNDEQCLQLLIDGTINAWVSQTVKTKYLIKKFKSENIIHQGEHIKEGQSWIAGSLNMKKEDQQKIINAIKNFKKTPKYRSILKKYDASPSSLD